ncbi:cytochrome biogenesis protein [Vibrio ponticus]|uniref:Cytochrome biogenesis protein n=1 Tax=Vibrio ponticus TaxID=265668 RepID=A0ABX3FSF4_9VIBR|nr:sulfite exporter TauE/SafE family protein [Vibrio ponticus]OLQ95388.1 cytochrome biogenesis protein [Vibrio ponticus]
MNADFVAAFFIGLVGAGHCVGMCGGVASLLSMGKSNPSALIPLYYNVGRILSYALIGGVVGGAVSTVTDVANLNHSFAWLRLIAALFMVLLACYIARWWQGLLAVEKLGQSLWKFISPAGKKLLPLKNPLHAIPFGFIWGWLPCGLVYSTLTWAVVSGSSLNGALIMMAFGLGTLPAMVAVGYGSQYLHKLQQSTVFRNIAAVLILAYGIYTAYGSLKILTLG